MFVLIEMDMEASGPLLSPRVSESFDFHASVLHCHDFLSSYTPSTPSSSHVPPSFHNPHSSHQADNGECSGSSSRSASGSGLGSGLGAVSGSGTKSGARAGSSGSSSRQGSPDESSSFGGFKLGFSKQTIKDQASASSIASADSRAGRTGSAGSKGLQGREDGLGSTVATQQGSSNGSRRNTGFPQPSCRVDRASLLLFENFYFGRNILNIVALEGLQRFLRPRSLLIWRRHLARRLGFSPSAPCMARLQEAGYAFVRGLPRGFAMDTSQGAVSLTWQGRSIADLTVWTV